MNKPNAPITNREKDAATSLTTLLGWGVAGIVVGGIIFGISLASGTDPAECGQFDDCEEGNGAAVGIVIGALLAGVGQMLTLVAVIGYGVFLGIARAGGRPVTAEPTGQGIASWRQEGATGEAAAPGTGLASFRKAPEEGTPSAPDDHGQD